ncbi:MAG: glycoside hydrolase family 2 protein [Bacteroidota bacterium]
MLRTSLLLFAVCWLSTSASAQSTLLLDVDPLIVNVQGRTTTSLDGSWRAILDPFQTGYYSYRMVPSDHGFFRDRERRSPDELIEYDFDLADLLHVPGDWNSQREDLLLYEGTIWYRRTFDYDLPPGQRLFIHFGGANYETRAWLNGEPLGEHEGGFTPFNFEATDLLRSGNNSLVVMVDNKRRADAVPTNNFDWWNYGGITRSVHLVETPSTFVRDYVVQLDPTEPDQVAGWVQLDGPELRQDVRIAIPEIGVEEHVTTDAAGYAEIRFPAALERWSPENPRRYTVTVSTDAESISDRIGFRTVSTRGSQILLNEEPVFLRGISIHEEAPYEPRRAFSEDDSRTLLEWARDLGANFVRLAHYPHNETMVRMADSLGLMVWGEIPVYWTIDWANPVTLANARNQLAEMITRDRNRAAVVLWSVANETPLSEPRLEFLRTLVEDARALDPTRLLTAALEHHYIDDQTLMIDDPLGEYLDVLGNNEYIGWYDGPPEKAARISWQTTYDKPVVMSEFGGGAVYNRRGSEDEIFTEDYLASLYRHQIAMLRRIPFLAGTSPWILKDFRSPRRPLSDTQDFWNRKGLVSDRGQRKMAFYILRDFYLEKAAE